MELVPAALPVVQQVILQRLPHKHMNKEAHQQYLHNTFKVAELSQAGAIREALLLGVIGRLLEVRMLLLAKLVLFRLFDTCTTLQVDVEIKYEDLDELDDNGDDEDVVGQINDASNAGLENLTATCRRGCLILKMLRERRLRHLLPSGASSFGLLDYPS